jgi:1-acyl-sn-glycerol-3-phosphate acyltransferase
MERIITLFYSLIRPWVLSAVSFSFRHVYSKGYEPIRSIKPAIFAANHQITFLDGMVIIRSATDAQPHVLVRSDIFRSAVSRFLLRLIRLLPMYRRRDNMGSITQNEQVFEMCFEIFANKGSVILFPEGSHLLARQLRPLQKGISRIAFGAEERHHNQLGLHIVPVGINYQHYTRAWTDLHLNFGRPIDINARFNEYRSNPNRAMNQLKEQMHAEIKSQMLDVDVERLPYAEQLRNLLYHEVFKLVGQQPNEFNRIEAEQLLFNAVAAADEDKQSTINHLIAEISDQLRQTRIALAEQPLVSTQPLQAVANALRAIVFTPFIPIAALLNLLPNWLIYKKLIPIFKDPAWWRSIHVAGSWIIYSLVYGVYTAIAWIAFGEFYPAGVLLFSFPLVSIAALEGNYYWAQFSQFLKLRKLFKGKPELIEKIKLLKATLKEIQ